MASTRGHARPGSTEQSRVSTPRGTRGRNGTKPARPYLPRPRRHATTPITAANITTTITLPEQGQTTSRPNPSASPLAQPRLLLNQLVVRHRNQHRTQHWWKHLTLLRKAVNDLSRLSHELELLLSRLSGKEIRAEEVRARFDRETELRRRRELCSAWVRETLVPGCWVAFASLVGDTQFANLGVVLVALLAEVAAYVGLPSIVKDKERGLQGGRARSVKGMSLRVTGADSGSMVERVYGADDLGVVVDRGTDLALGQESRPLERKTEPAEAEPEVLEESNRRPTQQPPSSTGEARSVALGIASEQPTQAPQATSTDARAKKRRKKGNAIDDMFADLM